MNNISTLFKNYLNIITQENAKSNPNYEKISDWCNMAGEIYSRSLSNFMKISLMPESPSPVRFPDKIRRISSVAKLTERLTYNINKGESFFMVFIPNRLYDKQSGINTFTFQKFTTNSNAKRSLQAGGLSQSIMIPNKSNAFDAAYQKSKDLISDTTGNLIETVSSTIRQSVKDTIEKVKKGIGSIVDVEKILESVTSGDNIYQHSDNNNQALIIKNEIINEYRINAACIKCKSDSKNGRFYAANLYIDGTKFDTEIDPYVNNFDLILKNWLSKTFKSTQIARLVRIELDNRDSQYRKMNTPLTDIENVLVLAGTNFDDDMLMIELHSHVEYIPTNEMNQFCQPYTPTYAANMDVPETTFKNAINSIPMYGPNIGLLINDGKHVDKLMEYADQTGINPYDMLSNMEYLNNDTLNLLNNAWEVQKNY
jgi:hypothetical protein